MGSSACDDFTKYDKFFPAVIAVMKIPQVSGQTVEEVSATQFKKSYKDEEGIEYVSVTDCNPATGEVSETTTKNGEFLSKEHRKIHKDPLRFEAWQVGKDSQRI